VDLYFFRKPTNRYTLFSPSDVVEALEGAANDRVRRSITWLAARKIRLLAWSGRVLRTAHGYYLRFEDRMDPVERILKAMSSADEFVVHYGSPCDESTASAGFKSFLRWQRLKHVFWFVVDVIVCGIMVVFIPVLAPIPGPNVFFYYPFLRLLSHYRALRGIGNGLYNGRIEFKCLPELSGLDHNAGLERFLERIV
jgi:hypothetical protein